jgi:hypothetical protein
MRPTRPIRVPCNYLKQEALAKKPAAPVYDPFIYHTSLFIREYLSTFSQLLLTSRLGGDMLLAGPIVSFYVNIVFRRPMTNPLVLTLACASAGDWKRANVSGYPGFNAETTRKREMLAYWIWLLSAQLLGACTAAYARALNGRILGDEFIRNAASGTGQMYLRVNLSEKGSCWRRDGFGNSTKVEIPIRLLGNLTESLLKDDTCLPSIQWRWWFAEDLAAALFLIVAYIHIWRWLRWVDKKKGNPEETQREYWTNIVIFSASSASLGLMNAVAFPTANTGWHNSMFAGVYQSLRPDLTVTSSDLREPYIRAFGSGVGCLLAMVYEWMLWWIEKCEDDKNNRSIAAGLLHKIIYILPIHME